MGAEKFDRIKDAPWFSPEGVECLIGGAGGTGSWTTLLLARAGFKPVVYDFDILETHNLGGQLYRKSDVGKYKVEALQQMCLDFSDTSISVYNAKITEETPTHYYCFSAFDNMLARKAMFDIWKKSFDSHPNPLLIDMRLEAEQIQIFCVTPLSVDLYVEEHLFNDSEVEDAPCTFKQTSHCAAIISGQAVSFFTNHITNIKEGNTARAVPFYYEKFLPISLTID
jgi:hypothetical protein